MVSESSTRLLCDTFIIDGEGVIFNSNKCQIHADSFDLYDHVFTIKGRDCL